ncbi:50S ribosomal protein L1 [Spirochaetota bacterium]|nr:50S ribosomal protein L1 [Spirochaetota bacterium]
MSKKKSKRYRSISATTGVFHVEDAIGKLKEQPSVKFDENVECSFALNLLKKHVVRDTLVYEHNFGKTKRVLVFAKGKYADEAKAAGADFVGDTEFIEKIKGGWLEFDVVIAVPDMMKDLAKIAQILGSRGLMPSPKAKTITLKVTEAVKAVKAGRREFRANSEGVLNFPVGKKSMSDKALAENTRILYDAVLKKKPPDLKGDYIRSIYITTTMGRSVKLNTRQLFKEG